MKTTDRQLFPFSEQEPQIGDYVCIIWADGSECECTYDGLDETLEPLPTHWFYVEIQGEENARL